MKKFFALLSIVGFCLISPPVHAETYAQVSTQVDGIFSDMVDQMWNQDDEYFHHGDYPRICALSRIITNCDPQFVECYSTAGWLMDSLGWRSDAEAYYQEGVRNNPTTSAAYYSLGMFYYNTLKDYDAAAATYQRDVAMCPNADVSDWKMLAHSYERLNRLDDAVATWKKIDARWPNGPAVKSNLNRILQVQREKQATPHA